MKTALHNIGYFLSEAGKTTRCSPLSNLFSVIGTGLILLLLGLVFVGWSVGNKVIDAIGEEAQISAYFTDSFGLDKEKELMGEIRKIAGVKSVDYIDRDKAYARMEEMLGEEAGILSLFDENPFEPFLEIHISLDGMNQAVTELSKLDGIDYIRDNREVLNQIRKITEALKWIGILMFTAVGITTLILISHMIRQGMNRNREQINTLRLLGAPEGFIIFPFLLAGTLLTLCGGAIAALLLAMILNGGYDRLTGLIPFLPLPQRDSLRNSICLMLVLLSAALGILGSLFGVASIEKEN